MDHEPILDLRGMFRFLLQSYYLKEYAEARRCVER